MVVSTVGLGVDDKDTVIHFNQSMKAVCIENDSAAKKDKSFLVGELGCISAFALLCSAVRAIRHRMFVFIHKSQKEIMKCSHLKRKVRADEYLDTSADVIAFPIAHINLLSLIL